MLALDLHASPDFFLFGPNFNLIVANIHVQDGSR
jgi:hypothetical protein